MKTVETRYHKMKEKQIGGQPKIQPSRFKAFRKRVSQQPKKKNGVFALQVKYAYQTIKTCFH